jgi:hypothetical protein
VRAKRCRSDLGRRAVAVGGEHLGLAPAEPLIDAQREQVLLVRVERRPERREAVGEPLAPARRVRPLRRGEPCGEIAPEPHPARPVRVVEHVLRGRPRDPEAERTQRLRRDRARVTADISSGPSTTAGAPVHRRPSPVKTALASIRDAG